MAQALFTEPRPVKRHSSKIDFKSG